MFNNASQWWKKKTNAFEDVFAYVRTLDTKQSYRQADNVRNMRLYGNMSYETTSAYNYLRSEPSSSTQNRVTLNIVQSMVDTAVAKITKNKPRPFFLTDGADFKIRRRAEKLTKFVEGQFYATNYYDLSAQAFLDACIMGTGALKFYIEDNEIKVERVFIDEIKVDDNEAYYGSPRQMHQTKWVHKDVLKASFPSYAKDIDFATSENSVNINPANKNGEMLLVIESWRLPSGKDKKDGRHTITIGNADLVNESYEKCYFPFVFFKWSQKPLGFFGQGIAEQLTGLQLEINKLLKTIQVSMHLVSVPKILIEASSKIVTTHLDNKIGGIIKYAGTKPEYGPLGSIPPELFSHMDRLYTRAYEIVGISQMSAQSQKPAGLNSGKALRTHYEIETERFSSNAKKFEQTFIEGSKILIDLAKEISKSTDNYSVKVPGSTFLKTINWKDVEMEEDQYMLQIYPTSQLSQTPSARLQEVQELTQAGYLSKEASMKLLDFPDLKSEYNMINAGVDDIDNQIELMLDTGEYQTPEPFQNLQYGITRMQQTYLKCRVEGAPEEIMDNLRQWMSDAKHLLDTAQMEAQQAAQPPQAVPQALPTSDLMPRA